MITDLTEELKELEKKEARLAKEKEKLQAKIKESKEEDKKLDELLKKSGYATPRALIKALMNKFNIRSVTRTGAAGKTPSKASSATGKRKRTKMTPELRDAIKKELKAGASKNSLRYSYDISYAVITKVADGAYDKLK